MSEKAVTKGSPPEDRLAKAMDLLERAHGAMEETAPDSKWCREYYLLTGWHMILTDEGWEPGESKQSYLDEDWENVIHDEVNAPTEEGR